MRKRIKTIRSLSINQLKNRLVQHNSKLKKLLKENKWKQAEKGEVVSLLFSMKETFETLKEVKLSKD